MPMKNSDDNPFAAPQSDLTTDFLERRDNEFIYGGFLERFAAAFIDGIISGILGLIVGMAIGLGLGGAGVGEREMDVLARIVGIVLGWLYFALQESSESQATLGKRAMNLKVVDLAGNRISFGRATGRYFAKIPSALLCAIGYLMQPFTNKKQALHDLLASTLVVK